MIYMYTYACMSKQWNYLGNAESWVGWKTKGWWAATKSKLTRITTNQKAQLYVASLWDIWELKEF